MEHNENKHNGLTFDGTINGHEYVDLGLKVKWATCNVGAASPSDYGYFYAWGEAEPKYEYTSDNCLTYNKNLGDSIAGNPQYDTARMNWGGSWRMPTIKEWEELVCKCKIETISIAWRNVFRVTGPNGNSILLPAAGFHEESIWPADNGLDTCAYFWSATSDPQRNWCSRFITFDVQPSDGRPFAFDVIPRDTGLSVRPVSDYGLVSDTLDKTLLA